MKPYYLVCYGHVIRVSERCFTAAKAVQYCFGISLDKNVTYERRTGPLWAYMSQKQKRKIIIALAQKHYDRTGNVLSGCAGDIKLRKKDEPAVSSDPAWSDYDPGNNGPEGDPDSDSEVHETLGGGGEGI